MSTRPRAGKQLAWWWRHPARPLLMGLGAGVVGQAIGFAIVRPSHPPTGPVLAVELAATCVVTVLVSYAMYALVHRRAKAAHREGPR